jgi:hypothetical protein
MAKASRILRIKVGTKKLVNYDSYEEQPDWMGLRKGAAARRWLNDGTYPMHRNVVCVSGSENHRAAGNAPMDLRFFVLRSPCHVGGGREAGMHSNTRVNGFLGMQSEDIHTGA